MSVQDPHVTPLLDSDRFEILRPLGAGGSGVVYEARDLQRAGTPVALKHLKHLPPRALERARRQVRAFRELSHPNLVKYGELVETRGESFFTMELIEGCDLLAHVRDAAKGGFDAARLRDALVQLTHGLMALHHAGLLHRNVRPSNIRVTPEGRVVLVDFGLTAAEGQVTRDDHPLLHSAAYLAPELAAGQSVGVEADWYALGAVLYEALLGRPPYEGSPVQILIEKQTRPPQPPSELLPSVPATLDKLCTDLLNPQPETRPQGSTVLHRLGSAAHGRQTASIFRGLDMPLSGREAELAEMEEARQRAEQGALSVVVVEAEAGFGKTALVRHFFQTIHERYPNHAVLHGRCHRQPSVPYQAFEGITEHLSRHLRRMPDMRCRAALPRRAALLAKLFPMLASVPRVGAAELRRAPVEPATLRKDAFQAFKQLLTGLTEDAFVTLAIDDLHLADAESLRLLGDLLSGPDAPPLLLLATRTPPTADNDVLEAVLEGTQSPSAVRRIRLAALPAKSAAAIAERMLSTTAGPMSQDVVARGQGNPLLITELARDAQRGTPSAQATSIQMLIEARLDELTTGARGLLRLLAAADVPRPQEALAQAMGAQPDDFARCVAELRVANLARSMGGGYLECTHAVVRSVLLEQLDPQTSRQCHAQLARALSTSSQVNPAQVAHHWDAAGEHGKAFSAYVEAAERAAGAMAFERAAACYRKALQRGERVPPSDRSRLHAELGRALEASGDCRGASEAYEAALEGAEPHDAVRLRCRTVHCLVRAGMQPQALTCAQKLAATVGETLPQGEQQGRTHAAWHRTWQQLQGPQFDTADRSTLSPEQLTRQMVNAAICRALETSQPGICEGLTARRLRRACKLGDAHSAAEALADEGVGLSLLGRGPRANGMLDRAQRLADDVGEPYLQAHVAHAKGLRDLATLKLASAGMQLERAENVLRHDCVDVPIELSLVRVVLSATLFQGGNIGRLAALQHAWRRSSVQRGDHHARAALEATCGLYVSLGLGKLAQARERIEESPLWPSPWLAACAGYAQAVLAAYPGQSELHETVEPRLARWIRMPAMRGHYPRAVLSWAHATAQLAAAARAPQGSRARGQLLRSVQRDAQRIERTGPGLQQDVGTSLRVQVAMLQGRKRDGDSAQLLAAAGQLERRGWVIYAHALKSAAGLAAPSADGRRMLREAQRWCENEGVVEPQKLLSALVPALQSS